MKRAIFIILFLIFFPHITARAVSLEYDRVLGEEIKERGVYDGKNGIVYASIESFEDSEALFLAEVSDGIFYCRLFDDIDGIQCTDVLSIPTGGNAQYTLSLARDEGKSYIRLDTVLNSKTVTEFFSVQNDSFTRVDMDAGIPSAPVISYKNGIISTPHTPQELYNFFNSLKENRISLYTMNDDINVINDALWQNISLLITACADISKFDIKSFDYDILMKYILNTHKNFRILTTLAPLGSENGDIGIVNADYIDYILTNYFRLTPEHPSVDSLVTRGFCYDNNHYYYKKAFSAYYSTEITDITHVYNAGGGVYYVIFKDIYRRANDIIPEYSFAVIQTSGEDCSLLRIGMGELPPDQSDILAYSLSPSPTPVTEENNPLHTRLMAYIIAAGIAALFSVLIILVRKIR